MRQFLKNNRLLIAAWIIVLAALGGGLGYLLLTPVPPPSVVDTVTLAVPAPPPPPPAPEAETLPEATAALPPEEGADPAATPEAADGAEAPEGAAAEETLPPEPSPAETAPDTAATPPAPESETIAIPQPKPEPPVQEETAPEQTAPEQAAQQQTAATAPDEPAPNESVLDAEPVQENAAPTVEDQQAVNVPLVPPSPEELPYWQRYRQPFNDADERPRVAVVLSGLGLSDSATQAAIDNLPAAITLSFSPYARGLERWIALARARGHEVMLDLPMEPTSFPNDDPGPQALLTSLSAEDNLDRLDWVLSRGSAYVGVAGSMGSRFTASLQQMEPVLKELKSRGLIFLDNRTTDRSVVPAIALEIGLRSAFNNRAIDERQASRVAIDARLAQIERIALSEGFAVAMAQPYPVTLDRLAEWSTELTARGIVIAPISAVIDRQAQR